MNCDIPIAYATSPIVVAVAAAVAASVVAAATAFAFKIIRTWRSERKKNAAALNLWRIYAKIAITDLEEIVNSKSEKKVAKLIMDDNPDNNYTPYIVQSEGDQLSFNNIRDIIQHTKDDEGKNLLAYFIAEVDFDAIVSAINSDVVRSISQERKLALWETYITYRRDALKAANKFVGKT